MSRPLGILDSSKEVWVEAAFSWARGSLPLRAEPLRSSAKVGALTLASSPYLITERAHSLDGLKIQRREKQAPVCFLRLADNRGWVSEQNLKSGRAFLRAATAPPKTDGVDGGSAKNAAKRRAARLGKLAYAAGKRPAAPQMAGTVHPTTVLDGADDAVKARVDDASPVPSPKRGSVHITESGTHLFDSSGDESDLDTGTDASVARSPRMVRATTSDVAIEVKHPTISSVNASAAAATVVSEAAAPSTESTVVPHQMQPKPISTAAAATDVAARSHLAKASLNIADYFDDDADSGSRSGDGEEVASGPYVPKPPPSRSPQQAEAESVADATFQKLTARLRELEEENATLGATCAEAKAEIATLKSSLRRTSAAINVELKATGAALDAKAELEVALASEMQQRGILLDTAESEKLKVMAEKANAIQALAVAEIVTAQRDASIRALEAERAETNALLVQASAECDAATV